MSKKKQLVDIDLNENKIYNGELPYLLRYSRFYEIPEGTEELVISSKDYSFSNQDYLEVIIRDNYDSICEPSIEFLNGTIVIKFTPAFDGGTMKLISDNKGIVNASIAPPYNGLCFTALEDNSSVGVAKNLSSPVVMYKSSDGASWENWDYSTINLNKGDKVYLKGEGTTLSTGSSNCFQFSMTGKISASGDCTSLTNGVISDYCYYSMFRGCTSLVTAPELPATTLSKYCYSIMFSGCTSLVNAPELPATTLASYCYRSMFYGCTSLVNAPELPATTLADNCYMIMFHGCTSLVNAPELPAITLAVSCYQGMFYNCTSLANAPELPATTLANNCYYSMFRGCTSLVTAPELPATTLTNKCYQEMFVDCTSLTTAPKLPATTLVTDCYSNMFRECTSLSSLTMLAKISDSNCSSYASFMLDNVASSGTFTKNPSANLTAGGRLIPSGWTVVNYAG